METLFTAVIKQDAAGNVFAELPDLKDEKGRVKDPMLSLDDFRAALNESRQAEKEMIHVTKDFVPKGMIDLFMADEKNFTVTWEVKGKKRLFKYYSGEHFEVPYPDLVFLLKVNDGFIHEKRVYALKKEDAALMQYPFGNVNVDGSICMGNISVDFMEYGVDAFTEDFFLGERNDDYMTPSSHYKSSLNQQAFLKLIEPMKEFPEDMLIPGGNLKMKNLRELSRYAEEIA